MSEAWNAEAYARHGAFVPALGAAVLELLAPQPGERILDLGCGDGALTAEIQRHGALSVGIDGSEAMVAAARARGIDARFGDAQQLGFAGEFEAVFSNAALHWMNDADGVIAGVARALAPGGRFVGEFGGHGNVAAICTALLAVLRARGLGPARVPWFFPTPSEYAARLGAHGFIVERIESIPRPTPLPTGMSAWLETFAHPFFAALEPTLRADLIAEVAELLAPSLRDQRGEWTADYVRLRFAARLARA